MILPGVEHLLWLYAIASFRAVAIDPLSPIHEDGNQYTYSVSMPLAPPTPLDQPVPPSACLLLSSETFLGLGGLLVEAKVFGVWIWKLTSRGYEDGGSFD